MVPIHKPFFKAVVVTIINQLISKMVFAIKATDFRIRKKPVILENNDLQITFISQFVAFGFY